MTDHVWVQRLVAVVFCWAGVWGYGALVEADVRPVMLAAAVTAALTVIWLIGDVGAGVTPADWRQPYRPDPLTRHLDPRFSTLSRLLAEASDRAAVGDEVHRTLTGLVAERLRVKHGIDWYDEPARAREVLGPQLADYLTDRPRPAGPGSARHLARLLTRIEAL
ncbi:MAG: hypothetical protein H0U28_02185 [Nocardioidaceae bacterium]|nr:hypothetical protein [Nocardioidaceae bacterium]